MIPYIYSNDSEFPYRYVNVTNFHNYKTNYLYTLFNKIQSLSNIVLQSIIVLIVLINNSFNSFHALE